MMKSSQSNLNLGSPSSYLARSYLIATVNKNKCLHPIVLGMQIVSIHTKSEHAHKQGIEHRSLYIFNACF